MAKKCDHHIFENAEVLNGGWSATAEVSNMDVKLYLDVYLCKPGEVDTKTAHRRTAIRFCPKCGRDLRGESHD